MKLLIALVKVSGSQDKYLPKFYLKENRVVPLV